MDRAPLPIAPSQQKQLKASLVERAAPVYWHGVVRQLLAAEPEVMHVAMAISLEELQAKQGFTRDARARSRWLPEPERAERRFTMISVDDHIVEPPHTFEGRAPAPSSPSARRVSSNATTGARRGCSRVRRCPTSGSTRSSGRPSTSTASSPTRFDQMRRGAWDIERPHRRHGPQRRLRVGVLPVVPARFRRPAPPAAHRRRRARARLRARVERLGARGLGRRTRPGA